MMKWMKEIYRRKEKRWCNLFFPLLLLIYPLVMVNQGVDVSDSTYSLSNFLFFPGMEGMWVVSTYVANVCGWLLTCLPFGGTLLGMKVYTGLVISATVLMVYSQLRRWMPAWIVFVGELVAIGFLWIPSTILYNYLTYFFFALGAVLLYRGLVEDKNSSLVAAGMALGLNIFVRIPNVTQMALIIGLWYYLGAQKKPVKLIAQKTGFCLAGYLAGAALPLLSILVQFGLTGLMEAIEGLGAITSADATYTPLAMLLSVASAYWRSAKWLLLFCLAISMGMAMFALLKGRLEKPKKLLYAAGIVVLLRFLWGKGMFTFRYYEDYTSIYEWGMLGLFLAWIAAIYFLGSAKTSLEEKLWAVLVLVILVITPLGSNNYTYQNLNNLFLAAPFTLYTFVKVFRYRRGEGLLSGLSFPWKAMVAAAGAMILMQSIGFHFTFSFRDGMDGTPRDYLLREPEVVAGMKTTAVNGKELQGLLRYIKEHIPQDSKLLLYGNCPGISFLAGRPVAVETSWPDLDSVSLSAFQRQVEEMEELPVIIIHAPVVETEWEVEKMRCVNEFMEKNQYTPAYSSESYTVYSVQGKE